MRIYRMTATFGKLENQTLTLEPGLNVISAPNEWGKSTWCTFLVTMLYGLDTREKTTKTSLAVKERFAPWSGSPMSGRIDLNWNGRDITIERWTKGRTPLGEFRAYETESGLEIPELTGATCGETLLGVERSVFMRAGFVRLSDMPVTQDESLRRRLNALVTTGDENNAGDLLAQKLKDLKNKCRYNRSGLLPQAEAERADLKAKLTELDTLRAQAEKLRQQQSEAEEHIRLLENHKIALRYAAAQADLARVEQAQLAAESAAERMAKLEEACACPLNREDAVAQLNQHAQLVQEQADLVRQWDDLPPEPQPPQVPERYRGVDPQDAIRQAEKDVKAYKDLQLPNKKASKWLWVLLGLGAFYILAGLLVQNLWYWLASIPLIVIVVFCLIYGKRTETKWKQAERDELCSRYPGLMPEQWVEDAEYFAETWQQYIDTKQHTAALRSNVQARLSETEQDLQNLTGGMEDQAWLLSRNRIIADNDALTEARREHQRASAHADTLRAMVRPATKPQFADELTHSMTETERLLEENAFDLKQLQHRLGQVQGRMDTLGSETALRQQLETLEERIRKLNTTYNALTLALQTLESATAELQRRFAPRITEQARELFGKLTDGRYDRLTFTQDLTINAGAADEIALRSAGWRSEGTVDQLYLALRLAVARELTPNAPLILDDALVRFDDTRHSAAMEILQEEANSKQVIFFTCQSRI